MMPSDATRVDRRTQEQRRATTERRVLDAAMELIAENGSHTITLAQVGETAGYSRGIVHHHFGNRDGLLKAIVRDAGHFEVPDYQGNALAEITVFTATYLRNIVEHDPKGWALLRLWAEATTSNTCLTEAFAERDQNIRRILDERIRAGMADGSIAVTVDVESSAVLLLALLRGTGIQLMSARPPAVGLDALIAEAERTVTAALGA